MYAVPVRSAGAVACLALSCAAFAAGPASAAPTVELAITPTNVSAGGTIVVTGSVTNTSKKPVEIVADYSVTGPCSYTDSYTNTFKLGSQQTRTASVNYTAPECAGTYTVYLSVTSGSGSNAAATASFNVN